MRETREQRSRLSCRPKVQITKTILVVDDDRLFCVELTCCLEAEGHAVTCAFDAGRAADLAGRNRYDVILLDVKMPGVDGLDLLRRIKELRPETPVILVTGRLMVNELVAAENASGLVAGIFSKPFDVTALIEKVAIL